MLINGHHRWAAYIRLGRKMVPITITNLTQWSDFEKMIKNAKSDKRVTLDLDEVVLCDDEHTAAEKPLPFPLNRFYKERIREGVPAVFDFLSQKGYDIWLYSAKYYSWDHIKNLFALYRVNVRGVVTGTSRRAGYNQGHKKEVEKMLSDTYHHTLHIDSDTVLKTNYLTKEFEEFDIDPNANNWAWSVIEIVGKICADAEEIKPL
jgi:hypothetical protein